MSAMQCATPGSQGMGLIVDRSGKATTSGSPSSSPPSTGTTSPIGVVPKTDRPKARPSSANAREAVDEDVAPTLAADEVRVADPHDVVAVLDQGGFGLIQPHVMCSHVSDPLPIGCQHPRHLIAVRHPRSLSRSPSSGTPPTCSPHRPEARTLPQPQLG